MLVVINAHDIPVMYEMFNGTLYINMFIAYLTYLCYSEFHKDVMVDEIDWIS